MQTWKHALGKKLTNEQQSRRPPYLLGALSNGTDIGRQPGLDQLRHQGAGQRPLGHHDDLIPQLCGPQRLPITHCGIRLYHPLPRELLQASAVLWSRLHRTSLRMTSRRVLFNGEFSLNVH